MAGRKTQRGKLEETETDKQVERQAERKGGGQRDR